MVENLPTQPSKRVADFLERAKASHRGRLIFVVDATASRQPTWDASARLQAQMFDEASRLGTLDVQLVYFRGERDYGGECTASPWTSDGRELARRMTQVTCITGHTQYGKAFEHVRKEHAKEPVSAVVVIGDMCEESAPTLYDAVGGLGVPCFMFQEGGDRSEHEYRNANEIFREIARLTKGAFCVFDAGSIAQLRELLQAVARFAVGGLTALADLRTDAARKLLGQMKK